ncbi:MAG: hypothetical protein JXI33_03600 [Candidatus Aminicenantes bacterium]|nr:hypothetical protein [Candidatus Aminicenantes bacterium]
MKNWMVKLVLFSVIIAVSIVYLHGFWLDHDADSSFYQQHDSQIGNLITASASELLQSASDTFLFMNEIQIADAHSLNSRAALQQIDLAMEKVEHTLKIINGIIAVGSAAIYDEGRIKKLKAFNYGQYARDNGLSMEIMSKVAAYLNKGNVIGFCQFYAGNLESLINILNRIKTELLAGKLSENQVLWSLLQQYDSTMMFGNYASLVFNWL